MEDFEPNSHKSKDDVALAISLYRLLDMPEQEKAEAINSIFVESQNIWLDCVNRGLDINQMCIDETGIDVIGGNRDERE